MDTLKKLSVLLATTILMAIGFAMASSAAQAAPRDGNCEPGEFCYYYNSDNQGSVSDFVESVGDYGTEQPGCYEFRGPGNGKGECIKNEAAAVWNRMDKPVTVYFNSNFDGSRDSETFAPGAKRNLKPSMKNNNASHRIEDGPKPTDFASPVPSHAVAKGWPNYASGGYHGAWDYSQFRGDFWSACRGTVESVKINPKYANSNAQGVSGSSNYVWIRCANGGAQMGYAHFYARDLPGHIKPGYRIRAGERIAPVGNQGNSTGTHLHFEVRVNGQRVSGQKYLRDRGVQGLPAGG